MRRFNLVLFVTLILSSPALLAQPSGMPRLNASQAGSEIKKKPEAESKFKKHPQQVKELEGLTEEEITRIKQQEKEKEKQRPRRLLPSSR